MADNSMQTDKTNNVFDDAAFKAYVSRNHAEVNWTPQGTCSVYHTIRVPDQYESVNVTILHQCNRLDLNKATKASLAQLHTAGSIKGRKTTKLDMPELKKCSLLEAFSLPELCLPKLEEFGSIELQLAESIDLPIAKTGRGIFAENVKTANLGYLHRGVLWSNRDTVKTYNTDVPAV